MITQRDVQQIIAAINADSLSENDKEKAVRMVQALHQEVLERRLAQLDALASRDFWRRSYELGCTSESSKDV